MEKRTDVPDDSHAIGISQFSENFEKMASLASRLAAVTGQAAQKNPLIPKPDIEFLAKSLTGMFTSAAQDPKAFLEQQFGLWESAFKTHSAEKQTADKRFQSEGWTDNPYFTALRNQYLSLCDVARANLTAVDGLDEKEQLRLDFLREQLLAFLSPSNFPSTNPDVIKRAIDTQGASMTAGLETMIGDMEANGGRLAVSLADRTAFQVGENVAASPGQVVFENRMFQLIQYVPTTPKVHAIPLVIFPPWVNKFYILDLQEKNSFIRFAVAQGFTVFIVSWINPDASYAQTSFDDYMIEGARAAIDAAKDISGSEFCNAVGYCMGGTLLSCTMAWMAQKGIDDINAATLFTTILDFTDPGDLGALVNENAIASIKDYVSKTGIVEAHYIMQMFSFLRPGDLVYGPAVKHYLLGEKPPAFDLLYWNQDGPNLPGKMALQFFEGLYVENQLARGCFEVGEHVLDLGDIETPVYAVATVADHIAPWKTSFRGINMMKSKDMRFVLAGSGHIAGVINPATSQKYGHWLNPARPDDCDDWFETAEAKPGSWWSDWAEWLAQRSGKNTSNTAPAHPDYPAIEPAPGRYVR
jgi:polyhydroxyalkanoate synthase subunit PhaC